MYIPEIDLLFLLVFSKVYSVCLLFVLMVLCQHEAQLAFSQHLQMASFLLAATGLYECFTKTLMVMVFSRV